MGRSTKQLDYNNVVNVNLKGMKKDAWREEFCFEVFKGYGETKEVIEPKATSISGRLKKVEVGGYDYTDETGKTRRNKTLTFYFDDGENTIKYGTGYNMVSRQIIYNLASIEWEIGVIELTPYWSKKGYRNIWVKNNGEDVRMKFDFNTDIKAKCHYSEEFQKTSYTELDKWIDEELIPEINHKLEEQERDEMPF